MLSLSAGADRLVVAPRGLVASPGSVQAEYLVLDGAQRSHIGRVTLGWPQQDLGLELEGDQSDIGRRGRATFGAQYSFTGNALADLAPAFSIGAHDILNQGFEGRTFFAALTKRMGLSRRQERMVKDFALHAGAGTGGLEGPFLGAEARLSLGLRLRAEYVARGVNASIGVPLSKYFELRGYSLHGRRFIGATFRASR